MGYLKIPNLYKKQEILLFKECWALEKIHGSSSSIIWDGQNIRFFSGGESHERFLKIFNQEFLISKFKEYFNSEVTIFGEVYGGKCQGMSETYGKELCFIAFDIKVGESWLDVEKAANIVSSFGLEFVPYKKISTDLSEIDKERDADSIIAIRRGIGEGKKREGVVLRPLIELTKNNGERVICKHKRDEFRETKSPRPVTDLEKLEVIKEIEKCAEEWVTLMRLTHILDKIPDHSMEKMACIIKAMQEDIVIEGKGEIIDSKDLRRVIGHKTVNAYKEYIKAK